jgi:hypothetical protein
MTAQAFPADSTLEALRVQRSAYAASGGEAAVSYDKLRDEFAVAKHVFPIRRRNSLPPASIYEPKSHKGAKGETLAQPPNPADATEAVYKELDEAEQQSAGCKGAVLD